MDDLLETPDQAPLDTSLGSGGYMDFKSAYQQVMPSFGQVPRDSLFALKEKILKQQFDERQRLQAFDREMMAKQIVPDIQRSEVHQADLTAQIDQALATLNGPAPVLQTGQNQGEMWAGAIGALLSPTQIPQVLNALYQVSGARNQMEFDAKLRQYGLTRETAKIALDHLQSQLSQETVNLRKLKSDQMEFVEKAAIREAEINRYYDNQLAELDALEVKRGWDLTDAKAKMEAEKALALEKHAIDKAKELEAKQDKLADNFRQHWASVYPSTVSVSQEDADAINVEARKYEIAKGLDPGTILPYKPRTAPATENVGIAREGLGLREIGLGFEERMVKLAEAAAALKRPADKVAKEKEFGKLSEKARDAIKNTAVKAAIARSSPPKTQAAAEQDLVAAQEAEAYAVVTKRLFAQGAYDPPAEQIEAEVEVYKTDKFMKALKSLLPPGMIGKGGNSPINPLPRGNAPPPGFSIR